MMGFTRSARGLVALAAMTAACSGGGDNPVAPSPPPGGGGGGGGAVTITAVAVQGAETVERGATAQLRAVAERSDGTSQDVSAQAMWRSSNPAVATVSEAGLLTAVASGSADISAEYDGKAGRRTVSVSVPLWSVRVTLSSLVVTESCDDFTQGLNDAELAYRIGVVLPDGRESVFANTGYPGSAQGSELSGVRRIRQGEVVSLSANPVFRLPGDAGQFVRLELRATEWDEQIVLIPPSTRWVRDGRMNDRLGSGTHRFSGDGWTGLGNNSIALGTSGCRVRLDYRVNAERQ
jgi:hypothetical protein